MLMLKANWNNTMVNGRARNLVAGIRKFHYLKIMGALTFDIEKKLSLLEPESARHFERTVREMLLMAKSNQHRKSLAPFGSGLALHPAVGTWPATLDVDRHLTEARNESGS